MSFDIAVLRDEDYPTVSAAELRMPAWIYGILPAFKSFNENVTFSQV